MSKTCTVCTKAKPLAEFWSDQRRKNGLMARCKSCKTEDARNYRASVPGYGKAIYQRTRTETRERHLIRKYGVTLADYDRMLLAQNGQCAICNALESEQFKQVFHVDHCHTTGRVRGLLCRGCNHMLGAVEDSSETLQRAITYLDCSATVLGAPPY
jgi:hypothetical protein